MRTKHIFSAIIIFIIVLLIASSGTAFFFYQKYRSANQDALAAGKDVRDFMKVAGNSILLPKEDPVAATVSDKNKLQSQAFFKSAENGDKVFIYAQSGLAVLFRPSISKIVQVATIQPGPEQKNDGTTTSPSPIVQSQLTITLANGSTTVGITKSIEKKIVGTIPTATVSEKITAKSTSYTETLIVDVKNSKDPRIQSLATLLKASVVPLPAGEAVPQTDVLVIVGAPTK